MLHSYDVFFPSKINQTLSDPDSDEKLEVSQLRNDFRTVLRGEISTNEALSVHQINERRYA